MELLIKGMEAERVGDGASCVLQVRFSQRTQQKYRRCPDKCQYTCTELLPPPNPAWHPGVQDPAIPPLPTTSVLIPPGSEPQKMMAGGFWRCFFHEKSTNDGLFCLLRGLCVESPALSVLCCTFPQKYKSLTQRRLN